MSFVRAIRYLKVKKKEKIFGDLMKGFDLLKEIRVDHSRWVYTDNFEYVQVSAMRGVTRIRESIEVFKAKDLENILEGKVVVDKTTVNGILGMLMSAKAKVELKDCLGFHHSEVCQDLTRLEKFLYELFDVKLEDEKEAD